MECLKLHGFEREHVSCSENYVRYFSADIGMEYSLEDCHQ